MTFWTINGLGSSTTQILSPETYVACLMGSDDIKTLPHLLTIALQSNIPIILMLSL